MKYERIEKQHSKKTEEYGTVMIEKEKLAHIFFHLLDLVGGESWVWLLQLLKIKSGGVLLTSYMFTTANNMLGLQK